MTHPCLPGLISDALQDSASESEDAVSEEEYDTEGFIVNYARGTYNFLALLALSVIDLHRVPYDARTCVQGIDVLDAGLLWFTYRHPKQSALQFFVAMLWANDLTVADAVAYFAAAGIADPGSLNSQDLFAAVRAMSEAKS